MPRKPFAAVQENRMHPSKGRPLKKKRRSSSSQQQHKSGPVHYKIIAYEKENASAEKACRRDDHLGFLIVESRNASFSNLRAAVEEELDPESIPGPAWRFFVPNLGTITKKQEEALGPAAIFFDQAFNGSLGDGSVDNPYQLSVLSP